MLSLLVAGLFFTSTVSAKCSSYTVNTTQDTYQFNHYKFLDFRTRDSSFLNNDQFTSQYRPQSWANGKFQNLVENVAITSDTVNGANTNMLSLYARQKGGQATAAELESSISNYYYASVRMGVRVKGAPGACAGLFFYHSDTQETDIEILTREQVVHLDAETMQTSAATKSQIHLTNQPRLTKTANITPQKPKPGSSSFAAQKTAGTWEDFNTFRIDWIPGNTKWWQNGLLTHSADKNLIQNPSSWMLNIWSNGDPSWSGTMAPDTEARMDILWMEMAYNLETEGQPKIVAGNTQPECKLGPGNGSDLENPVPATTTAPAGAKAAVASPAKTAPKRGMAFVA